jgi:hypothetical protein
MRAPCVNEEFWKNVTGLAFADGSSFHWIVNERGACIGLQDLMFRLVSMSEYRHAEIQRAMDFVVTVLFEYHCIPNAAHNSVWTGYPDSSMNFMSDFMRMAFCLPHFWVSQCHKFDRTARTCNATVYYLRQHPQFFTQCRRLLDDFEIPALPLGAVTLAQESSTLALVEWSMDFQGIFAATKAVTVERCSDVLSRNNNFYITFDHVEQLVRVNFPSLTFLNIGDRDSAGSRMGSLRKLFRLLVRRDTEVAICSRWTVDASLYLMSARAMDTFIRADALSLAQLMPYEQPRVVKCFFRHPTFEKHAVHLIDLYVKGRLATEPFHFKTPASKLSAINRF